MKTRYNIATNPHYMRYHQWVERLQQMYGTSGTEYDTIYEPMLDALEYASSLDRELFFDPFYDSNEICTLIVKTLNKKQSINPEIMMAITLYCYETE